MVPYFQKCVFLPRKNFFLLIVPLHQVDGLGPGIIHLGRPSSNRAPFSVSLFILIPKLFISSAFQIFFFFILWLTLLG